MPRIKVQSGASPVELYYEDWGSGTPVVLIHGWPLDHQMWEHQMSMLPQHNIRCIAYDRRGFGKSDKPWSGYDYDTLSKDLSGLLDALDLTNVTLVGFSMGGGEVARYLSLFGSKKVSKAVLISSVTPILIQTEFNPEGVERAVFDEMILNIKGDRAHFLSAFGKQFYGQSIIKKSVSEEQLQWTSNLALAASPVATTACVRSFSETDFRSDLTKIDVPTLIIHGDADQTVPFDTTAKIATRMIPNCKLVAYEGAPHGLFITEKERLNRDLLSFVKSVP